MGAFDPNDPNNRLFYGVVTGFALMGLFMLYSGNYKEVTWKEFVTNYLTRNLVSQSVVLPVCYSVCLSVSLSLSLSESFFLSLALSICLLFCLSLFVLKPFNM